MDSYRKLRYSSLCWEINSVKSFILLVFSISVALTTDCSCTSSQLFASKYSMLKTQQFDKRSTINLLISVILLSAILLSSSWFPGAPPFFSSFSSQDQCFFHPKPSGYKRSKLTYTCTCTRTSQAHVLHPSLL